MIHKNLGENKLMTQETDSEGYYMIFIIIDQCIGSFAETPKGLMNKFRNQIIILDFRRCFFNSPKWRNIVYPMFSDFYRNVAEVYNTLATWGIYYLHYILNRISYKILGKLYFTILGQWKKYLWNSGIWILFRNLLIPTKHLGNWTKFFNLVKICHLNKQIYDLS